jgi:tryptophanase
MHTIIEPFKIRTVEPIRLTAPAERQLALEQARHNLFRLRARDVTIDLLTDSGTGAMSTQQWAAMMTADESYAGGESFYDLEAAVREVTGYPHVLPVHQGRAAERIVCELLLRPGDAVPNNTHFDTTRANIEHRGARAVDLPVASALEPATVRPFKGNMDLERLGAFLAAERRVPMGMLTITNNAAGGQPVSMANVRAVGAAYRERGIPFLIDGARFAENSYLIQRREPGYRHRPLPEIARETFDQADGCLISMKKDGLVNIGGVLALRDDRLAERARNLRILTEGFPTYGGLAGRDLAAMAQGLREVLDEHYLAYRAAGARYLAERLEAAGVPTVRPPGLHAVYVDARALLPHIPPWQLPGQAVCCELYRLGGIRAVEIGTLMFGGTDPATGRPLPAPLDLVRLALPRRVYTQSHIDWVVEAFAELVSHKDRLRGYEIVSQPPFLRAFTAELRPLPAQRLLLDRAGCRRRDVKDAVTANRRGP